MLPEDAYTIALKAGAVVVERSLNELLWDINVYRYALQKVIDTLWELGEVPTISQAHQMFYKMLRELYGFHAHVAKQLYKYAIAMVRSARRNGGTKPVLKKLSIMLDRYDAVVDAESWTVRVSIRGKWYTLRLKNDSRYLAKFTGRRWYEVIVKWERGRLYVVIPFRFEYKPYTPREVVALDINLRDVAVYDSESIKYLATRFDQALGLKKYAERVQRRHPRAWRRSKRRSRRLGYAVAVENLERLWHTKSRNGPSRLAWLLSRFAYRRLLQAIITKCIEYNVPLVIVDARGTSTTCPRCGSKLAHNGRAVYCPKCGLRLDRDYAAAINIHRRALAAAAGMRGARVPPDRGAQ